MRPDDYLTAARVPSTVRPQSFGLWHISREDRIPEISKSWVGWDSMTVLRKITIRNLHLEGAGEVVMNDALIELRRHLPIWMKARGRVLVTGLGLGCVVRGLLINPEIQRIDVVEIDKKIIKVIWPEFENEPRCHLHHGDALNIEWSPDAHWDFAWHDLHSDGGKPHLQTLHVKLIKKYWERCERQGAWMLSPSLRAMFHKRAYQLPAHVRKHIIGLARR